MQLVQGYIWADQPSKRLLSNRQTNAWILPTYPSVVTWSSSSLSPDSDFH